jgi:hypothetical protein
VQLTVPYSLVLHWTEPRAIMDHLVPPIMEVSSTQNFESKEAKSLIIWAVLQVPIRMNDMQEAGCYKSHPGVSLALSNFLFKTRVYSAMVEVLDAKVAAQAVGYKQATNADLKRSKA